MDQRFTHLEWDTEFLGYGVGRIMSSTLTEAELSKTLEKLRSNDYRLVYWQVPVSDQESYRIAQLHGGFLADERVTYLKELVGMTDLTRASIHKSCPYQDLIPDFAMVKLALQSGEYSRFRLDPRFPRDLCDRLYTCWITRSVSKEIAWEVLVVKERQDLLGLITMGNIDGRGSIGLVAVEKHARGMGIGRALVTDADKLFANRGYTHVQVVTQRSNLGACRLYESCGYQIEKIEYVFHFWL